MDGTTPIRFNGIDVLNVEQDEGPLIWWSEDSLRWRRAAIRDFRAAPAHEWLRVNAIAAGESGLVAVGQHGDTDTNTFEAVAWKSADGKRWDRIVDENFGPGGHIPFVGATGAGFIAFGRDSIPQGLTGADGSGVVGVWVSADGSQWERVTSASATQVAGGLARLVQWDGTLTAFVVSKTKGAGKEVWRSNGLTEWRHVSTVGDSSAGFVHVAVGPKGWLVRGLVAGHDAAWTSPDGISWRRGGVPKTFDASMIGVASGFVAVGYRGTGTSCATNAWEIVGETSTSPDGRNWYKLPDDPQFNRASIGALIQRDNTLVGVGVAFPKDVAVSRVWTADLAAVSAKPKPVVPAKPKATAPPGGCGEP